MNLNRNEYLIRRLLLLRKLEPPTISDIKGNLGELLSEIIFCQCEPEDKREIGLEPPLRGIDGELWTSPSDLLIGKVCLKPPLTSKHIRALTHQGILDIGVRIERLFWNQIELEKSKELEEQDITLRLLCESEKREAVKEAQKKMRNNFQNERMELLNEMDNVRAEEMRQLRMKYLRDLKEELREQEIELDKIYSQKVEEDVSKHSEVLTMQSNGEMEELEHNMKKNFALQLQKANLQAKFELEQERAKTRDELKKLRLDLECHNMANMMYIICMERRKCVAERDKLEAQLTATIRELANMVGGKHKEIKELENQRDHLEFQVDLRERCVSAIVKEFQKFINFTLRAYPKQAEYLLSAEKLMVYELTEALAKLKEEREEALKEPDHDRNYLWDKNPSTPTESKDEDLFVEDHHGCLKESEISESDLSQESLLAGFMFNEQLFVREDFRNMVSQGVTIDETDLLWTRHIQDIQDRLEQECPSCVFNQEEKTGIVPPHKIKSTFSYQSSVHFSAKMRDKYSNQSITNKERRRTSLRNANEGDILQNINFSNIGSEERRKTIISARSSLEVFRESLMKKRSSVQGHDKEETNISGAAAADNFSEESEIEQNVEALEVNEETDVMNKTIKYEPRPISETTEITEKIPQYNSKLSMARDSIEMIKERRDEQIRRKSSILKDLPINKHIRCVLSDCNVLKYKTSSELLAEKALAEEGKTVDTTSQVSANEFRNLKRQSVGFGGRFVIYNRESVGEGESFDRTFKKKYKKKPAKTNQAVKTSKKISMSPTKDVVMGDADLKLHLQKSDEFTTDRIHSFINIIKEYPNLIRLFTSVTR